MLITVRKIYEKVNLVVPVEERRFFNALDDAVLDLIGKYGNENVTVNGEEFQPISSLEDEWNVNPLYTNAIVDDILFDATNDAGYKQLAMQEAEDAYKGAWGENMKGRHFKRAGW